MKLSIIIPVYNEVNYLEKFTENLLNSFKKDDAEFIFINDGSTDGSDKLLLSLINEYKDERIRYHSLRKNKGKGFALREGLRLSKGEYILFQDSDLELDTNDSREMYEIISKKNDMDVIFGSRYLSGKLKRNSKLIYLIFGKLNSFIFNIFFSQSISDVHCGTKIITKKVKEKIKLKIDDFGFEIDVASQIVKKNFQIYEYGVSYIARTREQGKKVTWIDGIKSFFYLIESRFIDNEKAVLLSIIYSAFYMSFIGSYFGMGIGKILVIVLCFITGCFIGLKNKLTCSSLIFLSCYLGSLFSKGNGKIYTVLIFFILAIYFSKKISNFINRNTNNKFIKFFV